MYMTPIWNNLQINIKFIKHYFTQFIFNYANSVCFARLSPCVDLLKQTTFTMFTQTWIYFLQVLKIIWTFSLVPLYFLPCKFLLWFIRYPLKIILRLTFWHTGTLYAFNNKMISSPHVDVVQFCYKKCYCI